ncbi:MAG: hypothetical protein U9N03_03015 [Candidatus Caldatribacteriota bacterium]|nr:hypothetical protein [Candidatus Caldatribacteriota bacterium]
MILKNKTSQENLSTILGILAILFWGTTIAFSRSYPGTNVRERKSMIGNK